MVDIILKEQTEKFLIITIAIQKEPLKEPRMGDVDVNNFMDDEIKQIIKDGL
jgi:hypothetical protein